MRFDRTKTARILLHINGNYEFRPEETYFSYGHESLVYIPGTETQLPKLECLVSDPSNSVLKTNCSRALLRLVNHIAFETEFRAALTFGFVHWVNVNASVHSRFPHQMDLDFRRFQWFENSALELALATYHEGKVAFMSPTKFLSYYKVVNILFPKEQDQRVAIQRFFEKHIKGSMMDPSLELPLKPKENIGQFMYRIRNLTAHGQNTAAERALMFITNPNYGVLLDRCCTFMRRCAEHYISQKLPGEKEAI